MLISWAGLIPPVPRSRALGRPHTPPARRSPQPPNLPRASRPRPSLLPLDRRHALLPEPTVVSLIHPPPWVGSRSRARGSPGAAPCLLVDVGDVGRCRSCLPRPLRRGGLVTPADKEHVATDFPRVEPTTVLHGPTPRAARRGQGLGRRQHQRARRPQLCRPPRARAAESFSRAPPVPGRATSLSRADGPQPSGHGSSPHERTALGGRRGAGRAAQATPPEDGSVRTAGALLGGRRPVGGRGEAPDDPRSSPPAAPSRRAARSAAGTGPAPSARPGTAHANAIRSTPHTPLQRLGRDHSAVASRPDAVSHRCTGPPGARTGGAAGGHGSLGESVEGRVSAERGPAPSRR